MRHIHQGFLIVSATNEWQSAINNTDLCESVLKGASVPFKKVIGNVGGQAEVSFVVALEHEATVTRVADLFFQQSYLKVYGDNGAELVYKNRVEPLGYFQEYKGRGKPDVDFTLDPTTGIYWIVGPLQGLSAELTSLNKPIR
jgi:hypothetical protein